MTQHARVVSGTVVEILVPIDDHALSDCFPEAIVAECVDAPDEVRPGWTYDGKAFAAPVVPEPGPVIRLATTYQLMSAFSDAQRAAYPGPIKVWDQRLFSARDTPWPEDNVKIGRIADALGTTPKAWFDAALRATG